MRCTYILFCFVLFCFIRNDFYEQIYNYHANYGNFYYKSVIYYTCQVQMYRFQMTDTKFIHSHILLKKGLNITMVEYIYICLSHICVSCFKFISWNTHIERQTDRQTDACGKKNIIPYENRHFDINILLNRCPSYKTQTIKILTI